MKTKTEQITRLSNKIVNRKEITLRLPRGVYEALRAEAKLKGLSVNELILIKINPLNFDAFGV